MTAAFELTRPEHQGRFDVTVYQLGWRLGGKGASGRNLDLGARIEEHGLHLWFGFYANAFRMMRDVYEGLGRDRDAPISTVGEAFRACPVVTLNDHFAGSWHSHGVRSPRRGDRQPWEVTEQALPTLFTVAVRALDWALASLHASPGPGTDSVSDLQRARQRAADLAAEQGLGLSDVREGFEEVTALARMGRDSLLEEWDGSLEGPDASLVRRLIFTAIDAFVATSSGILADDVLEEGFEVIDGEEWTAWLGRHGASPLTVGDSPSTRAPILRSVYDVAFSFPDGDVSRANAAAGTATSDLLKLMFTYHGELAYKMTAGMGDVIFAPLYELLCRRGVSFRFFCAVTELRPSDDGRHVEEVDVVPQVDQAEGYAPLVCVKGLPCWPHLPLWDQLPESAKEAGARLETELDPLGRRYQAITLKRGQDFDEVVLAIPVGALGGLCGPLMAVDGDLRHMVGSSATVATQAFQLWTRKSRDRLGYNSPGDSVSATFVEPLDTYCDMGHLLGREDWPPEDDVEYIAYVCGVLDDRDETHAEATERVRQNALAYVGLDLPSLWPKTVGDPWSVLFDRDGRSGQARFDAQYWRANTAPWQRYVITPAGNVKSRLPSHGAAFANLTLAGDWTATGINGGCVEAAVISGLQAARSLTGRGAHIVGEDPTWLTSS